MDILSNFAERLKELANENNLSDRELAEKVGVHRTTIGKYLRGKDLPSLVTLVKFADLFGCTIEFLLGRSEEYVKRQYAPCPPFGSSIVKQLELRGVSKRSFARACNIPESLIYQWRDGVYAPSVVNALKVADFFEITADELLGRER